ADIFGVDAVRFFLLHEMPFDNDGTITWELMVERINSELANTLGNLVNRTISMSNKYFGGVVENKNVSEDPDDEFKATITAVRDKVEEKMEKLHTADALNELFNIFRRCNKYIDETMPWALAKDEAKKDRLATVLYNLVEGISIGANLLRSFMPETTDKILGQLNVTSRVYETLNQFGLYPSGNKVTDAPEILFARFDEAEVLAKVAEMHPEDTSETKSDDIKGVDIEKKPAIMYDDFAKLQFQVGLILECEEVPKSKKLLKSIIQVGNEKRQILSGIKQWYKPEDLIGKRVMVLANLEPKMIAGYESQGMVLCAEDDEGNLCVMEPAKDLKPGSEIG
ncbi:MAG: methionine--tRNA ligase subunit beta, partial [Lachnospiraceae bacterium]|nr:methionine--tRNA ligase subunit beta [Lachnospiraceae bacterium]